MVLALFLAATPPAALTLDPAQAERVRLAPEERLLERLAALAASDTPAEADLIADEVRSLWRQQAGPTADLLLQRAGEALEAGDAATAGRAYDHLRLLEPEFAEGWIASAELAAAQSDWEFALEALDRAVTLDPYRFDAWAMLGRALEQAGARQAALEAYQEALGVHPHHPSAGPAVARLERELAGRAL